MALRKRLNYSLAALLFAVALTGSISAFAVGKASPQSCRLSLQDITKLVQGDLRSVTDPFAISLEKSPRMLYNDGQQRRSFTPFFASNESDWYNTPWDEKPTDVMVGFGTNGSWDLAMRKNAKELVLADWESGPLVGQEFLQRPFILTARNPTEFLAMMAGVPLKESQLNMSLDEFNKMLYTSSWTFEEVHRAQQGYVLRMSTDPRFGQAEIQAVISYYMAIVQGPIANSPAFGPLRGRGAGEKGYLPVYFGPRYVPSQLIAEGAPKNLINKAFFSILSSQESFARLKMLFENPRYAKGAIDDLHLYQAVKAEGDAKGYRSYTFNFTNIPDAISPNGKAAFEYMQRLRAGLYGLFPAPEYDVTIFVTTNLGPPHHFIRLERNTPFTETDWRRDAKFDDPPKR